MPTCSNLAARLARALAATLVLAAGASQANIVYQFSFNPTDLPAFGVTLEYATYVTTTGMQAVTPLSQNSAASIGYTVNYAGTNAAGWWGFDDNDNDSNNASITDDFYSYDASSFKFQPARNANAYLTAPGIYAGTFNGNRPGASSFEGPAQLTIRDANGTVPEPASLALVLLALGAGAAAAAAAGRRTRC